VCGGLPVSWKLVICLAAGASAPARLARAEPPSLAASSEDIDLAALGLDPSAASFDDQLNVYGFAAFTYLSDHWSKPAPTVKQDLKTFALGNLNLYLAKSLTAKVRALAEVRFTFLPNAGGTPGGATIDTTATDVTNYSRPVQWGGIVIERAYVEYDLTEFLTVRGGHWLTPYGIWNIDHGAPAIISTVRPYIIGEQFFPEHQTGLDLFGSRPLSGFKLGYHLTMSNGRGGAEAQQDQDEKFAFGGRLELETPWGLRIGGSYYRGRYTGLPAALGAAPNTYLEAAYGGDAQLDVGKLHVQAEVIARDRHYVIGERAASAAGFAPDGRDFGFYGIAGYRLDHLWNVMPFVYYEDYHPTDHTYFSRVRAPAGGLNFRPSPSLVFKAMADWISISGPGLLGDVNIREFTGQVSWVF